MTVNGPMLRCAALQSLLLWPLASPQSVPWREPSQPLPLECQEFATCSGALRADWQQFRKALRLAVDSEATAPEIAMETYNQLMEAYTTNAGMALDCRLGSAAVFFRLGLRYMTLGFSQRAANLYQLAMAMFWDASRVQNGMECLQYELWGVNWFEQFMETYLTHAARLRRNDLAMLPHATHWNVPADFRDPSLKIAVFSLCDYAADHKMRWLLARSQRNREAYCTRHGYGLEWTEQRPASTRGRHPVWGQLAGPMELLEGNRYDWILSMDCDSLFLDLSRTVESLLYRFAGRETPWGKIELDPEVHWLISEDGRGLAGGNWIVRNSPGGRQFLRGVYGNSDDPEVHPYLRHDLRDQFSLLWHLVRPGVSVPWPPEQQDLATANLAAPVQRPGAWPHMGYLPGVRLVPQELLLGAYPHVSCSQPGDRAHRCLQQPTGARDDFIVSIPLLGSLPQDMAQAVLDRFLLHSVGSLGEPSYEQQLRGLCHHVDISVCLSQQGNR